MQSYPTKFHFKCCPSENKKNIVKLTSSQTTANSFVSFPSDSGYERHYTVLTDGSKATQGSTSGLTCNYQ